MLTLTSFAIDTEMLHTRFYQKAKERKNRVGEALRA